MNHIQDFLRTYKNAWQFAYKAHQDYLLARIGHLNCLWSSAEVAAQAIEKLLKAYLCFCDKDFNAYLAKLEDAIKNKHKNKRSADQCEVEITCYKKNKLEKINTKNGKIWLIYVLDNTTIDYDKECWYFIGIDGNGKKHRGYLHTLGNNNQYLHSLYSSLISPQPNRSVQPVEVVKTLNKNENYKLAIKKGLNRFLSNIPCFHDIVVLSELSIEYGLKLTDTTLKAIPDIAQYFQHRYMDNEKIENMSLNVNAIDNIMFDIWSNFERFNEEYYYTHGIFTPVFEYYYVFALFNSKGEKYEHNLKFHKKHYEIFAESNNAYLASRKNIAGKISFYLKNRLG